MPKLILHASCQVSSLFYMSIIHSPRDGSWHLCTYISGDLLRTSDSAFVSSRELDTTSLNLRLRIHHRGHLRDSGPFVSIAHRRYGCGDGRGSECRMPSRRFPCLSPCAISVDLLAHIPPSPPQSIFSSHLSNMYQRNYYLGR
jgi:hypothetical protein